MVINYLSSLSTPISDITNDDKFSSMIDNKVQVSYIQPVNVKPKQGTLVNALVLAKRWMISPDRAKNIVRKKNQRGIITVINP